jgi:hypothetical protein
MVRITIFRNGTGLFNCVQLYIPSILIDIWARSSKWKRLRFGQELVQEFSASTSKTGWDDMPALRQVDGDPGYFRKHAVGPPVPTRDAELGQFVQEEHAAMGEGDIIPQRFPAGSRRDGASCRRPPDWRG